MKGTVGWCRGGSGSFYDICDVFSSDRWEELSPRVFRRVVISPTHLCYPNVACAISEVGAESTRPRRRFPIGSLKSPGYCRVMPRPHYSCEVQNARVKGGRRWGAVRAETPKFAPVRARKHMRIAILRVSNDRPSRFTEGAIVCENRKVCGRSWNFRFPPLMPQGPGGLP